SAEPNAESAKALCRSIREKYGTGCVCVNCLELSENDISEILKSALCEFPLSELDVFLPSWVDALPIEHPLRTSLYNGVRASAQSIHRIRDVYPMADTLRAEDNILSVSVAALQMGRGIADIRVDLPRALYYQTISEQSGFAIRDDGDLMALLTEMRGIKNEYDRISSALKDVRETGYGIVVPSPDELKLEEPEIVRQGGRYGVRMRASAPSIHLIRADIETTVSPIVGNEKQSEDMVNYLLQEFEGDTGKLWQSNIFGRSFHEIVGEDLQAKLKRMPADAQAKLRQALERIINEGGGGLICIIL
ncbi:MAG: stage IV sporulation protein A, partial [Firmicutes bacterium]|nr:stage IV sporulation protein A [Bacillota bacterium]